MASITPTPPRVAQVRQDSADGERLLDALRPWRRRLATHRVLRWSASGLVVGLLLASLLLLISRLVPWATVLAWAGGVTGVCLLVGLALAIWRRPSLARTARLVDRRLSLQDRLGTAWELRAESAPLPVLQRRDALKQLSAHTPAKTITLRPHRSFLLTLGIVVLVLTLLVLLPNPMTAVLQQQAAFQARVAKQVAAIDHLRKTIDQQANIPDQQRKQIDQILRDTETRLKNAKNETEAQLILAQSQAKLNQLRNPQAANQAQARTSAGSTLQGSSNPSLNAMGQALSKGDSQQLKSSLQSLANQVSKMTPAQRAQLARQIEQAANQASKDPKLQAALHQLAKAVAGGNASEINDAANAVQSALDQGTASQAQSQGVDQASQGLQQAANNIASSTDGTSNQGQSQQGQQGQNPGQSQGQQGQGQNPGQGQGQQGQNPGQGNNGSGSGNQGKGGGHGNNQKGNTSGHSEQVYVPGQVGAGPSSQGNGGNNGVVQPGSSVPYPQVIAQYNQQAHDAIDNSSIPPDQKDLVHNYFDSLEGQK